jgi:hypothetical protein
MCKVLLRVFLLGFWLQSFGSQVRVVESIG